MIWIIVLGIFMFMTLVILHELGHFITARKSGVKVLEFGIGIPPKIFTFGEDKKGTKYTLNLIPLGGFCRLKGDDPNDKSEFLAQDGFISAGFWNKILILSGGILANLFIARIIFTSVFAIGTKPISVLPENAIRGESHSLLMPTYSYLEKEGFISGDKTDLPLIVDMVSEQSIARNLGLKPGDLILSINDQDVNSRNIGLVLKNNIAKDIFISYKRDDQTNITTATCPEDNCVLGIAFTTSGTLELNDIKYPLHLAARMGMKEIGSQLKLTFSALGTLGKNLISFDKTKIKGSLSGLTGPVGVIKFGGNLLEAGGGVLYLAFAGMISLALAIFNLLPIPALDGGRILGTIIQKIGGFKSEKYFKIEGYINTIFFILLMTLGVYIILKDLVLFWGIKIPFIG